MYDNLTQEFLEVIQMPALIKRITGTLDGNVITGKNIVKNSARIINQCSDGSEISIGQVYIGQLDIILKNISIPWKELRGKEIVLNEGIFIDKSKEREQSYWVDIPLGCYVIDDAFASSNGFECVAYDYMSKFDKPLDFGGVIPLTIYGLVYAACQACGVVLGMTQQQIESMPNGNKTIELYSESQLKEWRDLISICAQAMGANALINRNGELIFKNYKPTTFIDDTFTAKDRIGNSSRCSSFDTFYTSVSVTDMENNETIYYDLSPNNGLTMDLGSNPLLQGSDMETKCRAILNELTYVYYTPFDGIVLHRPLIYDLMDVVKFSGGILGEGVEEIGCITKFEWSLLGGLKIQGAGSNPALAKARSKAQKQVDILVPEIEDVKTTIDQQGSNISNISEDLRDVISDVEDLDLDKQNKITFDGSAPTPSTPGESGDVKFANGKMYVNDGTGWSEYQLSATTDIIHISNVDIGVGAQLATGHVYLVYEG